MGAKLEILGVTKVAEQGWTQSVEQAADVSGYTDAAVMVTIFGGTIANAPGTTKVFLQTAVDRAEDRWCDLAMIGEFDADPTPVVTNFYNFSGSGQGTSGGADFPGFARYLRVTVETDDAASTLTLDVQAIMKP